MFRFTIRDLLWLMMVVGITLAGVGYMRGYLTNRLVVVNQSGQTIKRISISVGGGSSTFENVPADSAVSGQFNIQSDDSFVVLGELGDGTAINETCGYVTNGMYRERAEFRVDPHGKIILKQNSG